MSLSIVENARHTEVLGEYDVLVAGGGIAGVAAALAAAREGARVLLVERECIVGGLATAGLIAIYLPLCDGEGRQMSFGISEELLRLSILHGADGDEPKAWLSGGTREEKRAKRYQVQFNPHFFALDMERRLLEEGVSILYDTLICETVVAEDRITHVIVENKSGRTAYAVKSVVDATGDADICKLAGAETAQFQQGNVLAQWYYYASKGKIGLRGLGAADIPDEEKKEQQVELLVSRRFTGLDGEEISEMIQLGHEKMYEDILQHRRSESDFQPVTMPTIPQIRMTRRIVGVQTPDAAQMHQYMGDSIGMVGDWRKRGPVYEIPFGSLYGRKIRNVVTAGRCISVTDAMWDITRVIPVCAVTGEAAGCAAAMTDDFQGLAVERLQGKLMEKGILLHEQDLEEKP